MFGIPYPAGRNDAQTEAFWLSGRAEAPVTHQLSKRNAGLLDADGGQLAAEQRVLHPLASAIEVFFHARLCGGRIATRDRIDDLEMCGGGPFLKGTELNA
jgi:hypothetical protein